MAIKLTDNERKALAAWFGTYEEFDVLSFKVIAKHSDLAPHLIRRTVRSMARKGVTQFVRGCMTEDGEMAGSGYGLTRAGRALMNGAFDEAEAAIDEAMRRDPGFATHAGIVG